MGYCLEEDIVNPNKFDLEFRKVLRKVLVNTLTAHTVSGFPTIRLANASSTMQQDLENALCCVD